jgi:hypothetical protein
MLNMQITTTDLQRHPDAELMRLCAQHIANWAACNDNQDDEGSPEYVRLYDAYYRTHDAIDEARPQTVDGLLAKARAAKIEAVRCDGTEDPDGTSGARWAWQIMHDLIRLQSSQEGA